MMSIRDLLQSHQVWFETLLHCPAPSATRRARSIRVPGRTLAKAVLIIGPGEAVLAVLPATHRIDLARLANVLGQEEVRIATEDEVAGVFNDCERGALPPFGRSYGLKTIVDVSLAANDDFVFVANLRHEGFRVHYRDYEQIEAPTRAGFALVPTPRPPKQSRRQAG
jgi:Ala-tRNA(Pro) deacylase